MVPDHNKHDKFVKFIFSYPDKARDYFKLQLPNPVLDLVDLDTLEQTQLSFVSAELSESFTDIVFKVNLQKSDRNLFISILIEHKSYKDSNVTVQMGYYVFSSLVYQLKKEGVAIPVIPLLFYHGTDVWLYKTHRNLYLEYGEDILQYIPDYEYIYHNLQQTPDEDFLAYEIKFWSRIFFMLKHARDEDVLVQGAGIIFEQGELEDGNLLHGMLVYFTKLVHSKSKTMKAIEFMPEPIQGKARNAYEEFILEGYEKGIEKGIEKGSRETTISNAINFFRNGVGIDIISASLKLSEFDVRKILIDAGLIKE